MAETRCERCLYYGVCIMPVKGRCEDFVNDEKYVEQQRDEYRDAFFAYLNAFENE